MYEEEIIEKLDRYFEKKEISLEDRYFITKKLNEDYWLELQGDTQPEEDEDEDLDIADEEEGEEPEDEDSGEEVVGEAIIEVGDEPSDEEPKKSNSVLHKPKIKVNKNVPKEE